MLLGAGAFNTAHAQTVVDSKMSGLWFDPTHNGEGFELTPQASSFMLFSDPQLKRNLKNDIRLK